MGQLVKGTGGILWLGQGQITDQESYVSIMSQLVWALPDRSGHTVKGGQQEVDGQNGSYQPTPVVTQPGSELGDVHLLHKPKPASAGWPAGFSSSAPIAMEYGSPGPEGRGWGWGGVVFV